MKIIKRILSVIIVVFMTFPMLTSCALFNSNGISKGEFFSIFIEEAGLYYISQTPEYEDIGYDAEAQAMVDWGLLPEEIAFEELYDNVTKEIVITVCTNNMYFVKEGDVGSIKDADKCAEPQLIANAVATGITELENGYFEAEEKLTREECIEYIHKSIEIDANTHFEDGTGSFEYDFGEDVQAYSGDDIDPNDIQIIGYNSVDNTDNIENRIQSTVRNLAVTNTSGGALGAIPLGGKSNETYKVLIPKEIFENVMKKPKVGDSIVYLPWQGAFAQQRLHSEDLLQKGFAGKIKSINSMPLDLTYECELEYLDDDTIVAAMKPDKYGKDIKGQNISKVLYETEIDGFKINFKEISEGGNLVGYSVDVEKKFKISQNEYNNWRDWTAEPKLVCSASITDFHFDCDNIGALFSKSKEEKTLIGLEYKVTEKIDLESGGLRLAPDSNRNGKFTSNISKSRFTSGAGAKSVKVGDINIKIPQIGLIIPIKVYLEISVDGKVHIQFDETNNLRVIRQNGKIRFAKDTCKSQTFEVTGNIDAGLRAEISVKFALMRKNLMTAYGKVGANITVYSKVYEDKKIVDTGFADAEDLVHERSVQDKMNFCLSVSGYGYLEFGLCEGTSDDNYLAKWIDISDMNHTIKGEVKELFHLEDGITFSSNTVKECTMNDDGLEVNKEGKIELESYKENIVINQQISLSVLSVPMKESNIEDNGGFKIKIKDKGIVNAEYDGTLNVLNIYGLKEGSTEIEILITKTAKNGKKKATYYKQEVSITVSAEKK